MRRALLLRWMLLAGQTYTVAVFFACTGNENSETGETDDDVLRACPPPGQESEWSANYRTIGLACEGAFQCSAGESLCWSGFVEDYVACANGVMTYQRGGCPPEPTPKWDALNAIAEAYCSASVSCDCISAGDLELCVSEASPSAGSYDGYDADYRSDYQLDAAALDRCLSALTNIDCADPDLAGLLDCRSAVVGNVLAGAPCRPQSVEMCAEGLFCDEATLRCAPLWAATGDPCDPSGAAGLGCNQPREVCAAAAGDPTDFRCRPVLRGSAGSACDGEANQCAPHLYCEEGSGGASCSPVTLVGEGSGCSEAYEVIIDGERVGPLFDGAEGCREGLVCGDAGRCVGAPLSSPLCE